MHFHPPELSAGTQGLGSVGSSGPGRGSLSLAALSELSMAPEALLFKTAEVGTHDIRNI